MPERVSAGILLYRERSGGLEVLLGHPGGPFWANKQEGAWSIPKGLVESFEDASEAAIREFQEETGFAVPPGDLLDLGSVTLRSGKKVVAWAIAGDMDVAEARSNTVTMEWPRGSGNRLTFPEIDTFRWCDVGQANRLLNPAQRAFVARLSKKLDHRE